VGRSCLCWLSSTSLIKKLHWTHVSTGKASLTCLLWMKSKDKWENASWTKTSIVCVYIMAVRKRLRKVETARKPSLNSLILRMTKPKRKEEKHVSFILGRMISAILVWLQFLRHLLIHYGNHIGLAAEKSGTQMDANLDIMMVTNKKNIHIFVSWSFALSLMHETLIFLCWYIFEGPLRNDFVDNLVEKAKIVLDEWK